MICFHSFFLFAVEYYSFLYISSQSYSTQFALFCEQRAGFSSVLNSAWRAPVTKLSRGSSALLSQSKGLNPVSEGQVLQECLPQSTICYCDI